MDVRQLIRGKARAAREAAHGLSLCPTRTRNEALVQMARGLEEKTAALLEANRADVERARGQGGTRAFLDRLTLTDGRIEEMAAGLRQMAALPDPVGEVVESWRRPSGLEIARVRVPLGVIGVIYESRPNVTADAAALCLKAGNACILRGGTEARHSNVAIGECIQNALKNVDLPQDAVQVVDSAEREAVGELLRLKDCIDVIVPRGGKGLIERVAAESRIPVIMHLEGNCHTYIDGDADPEKARKILINAKMRRTGVCGATETRLVDKRAQGLIPILIDDLIKAGCEVRGDVLFQAADNRVKAASDSDWDTEYLDAIIAARVVDGVGEAIAHINRHGSKHTEAIVTESKAAADRFLGEIDAAILIWNASTQFADGGEFGMGAEVGISTGRLHARGPVGVEQLTSFKYVVRGNGQIRPA